MWGTQVRDYAVKSLLQKVSELRQNVRIGYACIARVAVLIIGKIGAYFDMTRFFIRWETVEECLSFRRSRSCSRQMLLCHAPARK